MKEYASRIAADCPVKEAQIAISVLSQFLYMHYQKRVILLLDEYDTPLTEAFTHNYFDSLVDFMRKFFTASFKDNKYMDKCLLTGITRFSQESLFSDFNNPYIDTLEKSEFPAIMGYTEEDVDMLLQSAGLMDQKANVQKWYNGYRIGDRTDIYNPYSINCFLDMREFAPYWVNTSRHTLARKVAHYGTANVKDAIVRLMQGESIQTSLTTGIVYDTLLAASDAAFSLFLAAGLLKIQSVRTENHASEYSLPLQMNWQSYGYAGLDQTIYELTVPNMEIRQLYNQIAATWFKEKDLGNLYDFTTALLICDKAGMQKALEELAISVLGIDDIADNPKRPPENLLHGIVIGLTWQLKNLYCIQSNRESGNGRYDVSIFPRQDAALSRNPVNPALPLCSFCLEFKVFGKGDSSLEDASKRALKQIQDRQYIQNLLSMGIPEDTIRCYGIAFNGKEIFVGDTL